MSDIKLGKLIEGDAQRDAIHVAIAPVEAAEKLWAGEHVGIRPDGKAAKDVLKLGIVDPFLNEPIYPGQKFYLCLYQFSVTGMRHHWAHPAFEIGEPAKVEPPPPSKRWITEFAERVGLSYGVLMDAAERHLEYGDYLTLGGLLEGQSVPEEFWTHYEAITGKKGSGSFFSCSC